MPMVPQIPAEKNFWAEHSGEGHEAKSEIERTPSIGKEGIRMSFKVLTCEPCDFKLRFSHIQGIYMDPFRG